MSFVIPPRAALPEGASERLRERLDYQYTDQLNEFGNQLDVAIGFFRKYPDLVTGGLFPAEVLTAMKAQDNELYLRLNCDRFMDAERMLADAIEWEKEHPEEEKSAKPVNQPQETPTAGTELKSDIDQAHREKVMGWLKSDFDDFRERAETHELLLLQSILSHHGGICTAEHSLMKSFEDMIERTSRYVLVPEGRFDEVKALVKAMSKIAEAVHA